MRGSVLAAMAALVLFVCAGPAAADCSLQNLGEWPITMADRMAVAPAEINGGRVRLFIDTGSFFSTLAPETADRLKLRDAPTPPGLVVRGVTGAVRTRLATADDFTVGGHSYHGVQFLVGEHRIGPTDGLIGQNMLGNVDVEYDFANGVMRLFDPKGCGAASLAYWAHDVAVRVMTIDPITPQDNQVHGTATINGVKIRVVFDTGAARSMLSLSAARRLGVRTDGPGVQPMGSVSGVGQRLIASYLVPFDSVVIADEHVTDTRLPVADFDLGDTDMLLGADFFLSHRIFISKSQRRLYFTYNGGPVFDLGRGGEADSSAAPPVAGPADAADTPTDAGGFIRRADAFMTRDEFDKAIADMTSAIALQPQNAALYTDRGLAYLRNHQPVLAMADFDQTIKLHPEAPRALLARGELRLAEKDVDGARADFAAALKITPAAAAVEAAAYARFGLYQDSVTAFGLVIDGKPKTEEMAGAYLARCRARALWGQQLDEGLGDCNEAMRLMPGGAEYLQTRGMIYLRQGKFDAAISDFDAALRQQPRDAWSLLGRSLAERGKGEADKAAADLAAAIALDPKLPDQAKALGFTA